LRKTRGTYGKKVKAAGDHAEPSRFWNLLRGLSGKKAHVPSNQPISFDSDSCSNPKVIADKFLKQYVPAPRSDPINRKVLRRLHLNHPIDHSYTPFTSAQTLEAINHASSSTAKGPDGLTSIHLKHLGPAGIAYLMAVYNLSVRDAVIPAIWKTALILPILKPGKPPSLGSSYRPISLLSPLVRSLSVSSS
jgi:hypothetical protein